MIAPLPGQIGLNYSTECRNVENDNKINTANTVRINNLASNFNTADRRKGHENDQQLQQINYKKKTNQIKVLHNRTK